MQRFGCNTAPSYDHTRSNQAAGNSHHFNALGWLPLVNPDHLKEQQKAIPCTLQQESRAFAKDGQDIDQVENVKIYIQLHDSQP